MAEAPPVPDETPEQPPLAGRDLQQRLDAVVHDSLDVVLLGVGLLFLPLITLITFLTVPWDVAVVQGTLDAATGALVLAAWGLHRRGLVDRGDAHPALAGLAVFVLVHILLDHLVQPLSTGFILPVLVAIGVGSFLLHRGWFLMVFAGSLVTSVLMVAAPGGGSASPDTLVPLAAGLVLSLLIFTTRRTAYTSLETARAGEARRADELQETKREVEASERRLRTVIGSAPVVLFALDEEREFTLSDGRGLEALGMEPGGIVGKRLEEVFPGRDDIQGCVDRALEGEEVQAEVEVEGTIFDVTYVPLTMDHQEVGGVLGVAVNVTDRVEAKRDIERYAAELELSNWDLEQFAYAAAHDLQEPLRTMVSHVQLLERRHAEELSPEAREIMGYVTDAGKRMKTLVDALLAYSRVQRFEPKREAVDPGRVLGEVVEDMGSTLQTLDARVTWDGDLPRLSFDPALLREVLANLVANAVKFQLEGQTPRVHVSGAVRGGEAVVSVTDNGIGIAPEHQDRIFELFKRLHPRSRYAGTGIGLAMVRRIVERHGGEVGVESPPAEPYREAVGLDGGKGEGEGAVGSRFWFSVPLGRRT